MLSNINNNDSHNLVDLFQTSFIKHNSGSVGRENVQVFLFRATGTFGLKEINLKDEENVGKLDKWFRENRLIVVTRQIEDGDFLVHASSRIASQLKEADNLKIDGKSVVLKEVSDKDYASLKEIQDILVKNLSRANKLHKSKKSEDRNNILFYPGDLLAFLRKYRNKQILPSIKFEISQLLTDVAQNLIEQVKKDRQIEKKQAEEQNRIEVERADIKKSEILKEEIKKQDLKRGARKQEYKGQIQTGKIL